MRPVQIVTDSCSDLGKAMRERYNIDYAYMNTEYNGKETPASLDWEFYTPKALYDIMRAGNRVMTTQVPVAEFQRIFVQYLKQGFDIVYIACSSKQSGSVNTGAVVAKELLADYPEAQIFCIDSLNACMGEGLLAVRAAQYRDLGMDAAQIADRITKERKTVNEYVTVHNLDTLRRCGRVKGSAAFFGNLFGVKPIIIADKDGYQTPIKKVKGRQGSMQEIVSLLKESIVEPEKQTIFLAHADCADEAEVLRKMVVEQLPCKDVYVDYIGPIIGASIGPDALGIFAFGKEVTFAL